MKHRVSADEKGPASRAIAIWPYLSSLPVLALGLAFMAIGVALVSGCGGGAAAGGFGTGGTVLTRMFEASGAAALAIEGDGRIVATGGPFGLARYTAKGRLDSSFGRGGKVERDWDSASSRAIAIQRDGKIVLGGIVQCSYGNPHWSGDAVLARYTRSGRLDPSFGKGGKVQIHSCPAHSGGISALAIQRDGKIVAAGPSLSRFTPRGRLDPSFGKGGKVAGDRVRGGSVSFTGFAIQADGKIVAAGRWERPGRSNKAVQGFILARYTSDGKLDQSFGRGGVMRKLNFQPSAAGLAIQRDGKIVAVGPVAVRGGGALALTRYSRDGRLDPSFGADGVVRIDFPGSDEASAVAIQADGRIVVAGDFETDDFEKGGFYVARYTEGGQLDEGFGKDGRVETNLPPLSFVSAVAIQRDGKIVAVGEVGSVDLAPGFALVRYTRDGHLDS